MVIRMLEAAPRPELRDIHLAWGQAVNDLAERACCARPARRVRAPTRAFSPAPSTACDSTRSPRRALTSGAAFGRSSSGC
jgi:hypothetical protein